MSLRPKALLFSTLLWTLPGTLILPPAQSAQRTGPTTALVTAVKGRTLTLAVGKDDGAVRGMVYTLQRGTLKAKVQVTEVRNADSVAQVIGADDGFVVTVGDSGQFLGIEEIQQPLPAPSGPLGSEGTKPAVPTPATPVATATNVTPAKTALVTSVRGKEVTLGIGATDGAKVGAVYVLPSAANPAIKIQIVQARATDAQGIVFSSAEDAVLTVGDVAQFTAIQAMQVQLPVAPVAPVSPTPPLVVPPATQPGSTGGTRVPPAQPSMPGLGSGFQPVSVAPAEAAIALVTNVVGSTVTLSLGMDKGVTTATTLPVLRNGAIIGLVRIQSVSASSSTGVLLWKDDSVQTVSVGDAVSVIQKTPGLGSPSFGLPAADTVPAVSVRYETGASNAHVPKADKTYELLASLAAKGFIKSQHASVFADDGARRHSTSEDITFSRSQIAKFVVEAMGNQGLSDSDKPPAALTQLVGLYFDDLKKQGQSEADLTAFKSGGFQIGFSGQTRLSAFGGDDPTSTGLSGVVLGDRFGSKRYKSGYDSRTNIFGQFNEDLTFYAQIEAGSDLRPGANNSKLGVRKAYVSYNADKLVRGLKLDIGRQEYWWGTGHYGTTLLGDSSGGLDSFRTTFKRGSYEYQSMYAPLKNGPAGGARSLYGQNLSVQIGNQTKIGLANTLLSPKDRFVPKFFLATFSPISLFQAERAGGDSAENNLLFSGYIETGLAKGIRSYGEIFMDDFSFTGKNNIENRNGSVVGAHFFSPKDPARLGGYVEYSRLNSTSYIARRSGGARDADYDYFNGGAPLGYPIAPIFMGDDTSLGGAESLRLDGYFKPTKKMRLWAGIEYSTVNAEDENAARLGLRATGHVRQKTVRLAGTYDISRAFSLTARAQRVVTDQPNFLIGEGSVRNDQFTLEIARHF